jgi:uncharacterized RDD family membrane protein YckC
MSDPENGWRVERAWSAGEPPAQVGAGIPNPTPPMYGPPGYPMAPPGYPVNPFGYWMPGAPPPLSLADPGQRLAARAVDWVVELLVAVALFSPVIIWSAHQNPDGTQNLFPDGLGPLVAVYAIIAFLAVEWCLEAFQLALWGKTVGKRLVGLRVASAEAPHLKLTRGRALGRAAAYPLGGWVMRAIPIFGALVVLVDLLFPLWDQPYRQSLHDKMAGTVVLKDVPFQVVDQHGSYQHGSYGSY